MTSSAGSIHQGVWTHVCASIDASNVGIIYINGVKAAGPTNLGAAVSSGHHFMIGNDGSGNYWPGIIDDARIYNRALTAGEVMQLYSIGGISSGFA